MMMLSRSFPLELDFVHPHDRWWALKSPMIMRSACSCDAVSASSVMKCWSRGWFSVM